MHDSISDSLAGLNHEKSTASCHSIDHPVSNGHSPSAQSYHAGAGRVVGKESTLKPLNESSSSNLDSSVQMIIEKMHSGLEVDTATTTSTVFGFCLIVQVLMHGSETWPMKVEHELKLNCTEMSMIRWMCGVKLNVRKNSEALRALLGLEPVSLMIKKSRLRWFGHVERKDDNDWVRR